MNKLKSLEDLESLRQSIINQRSPDRLCFTVCNGTGCQAYGCIKVTKAFKDQLKAQGLESKVDVRATGCHGFCERGTIVVIQPKGIFYQRVQIKDIKEIVPETIVKNNIIDRLLYIDPNTGEKIVHEKDVPFYKKQQRLIFGSNGQIDPTSIDDYLAIGGYVALSKVLNGITPDEVIEEITRSGLRGRGGAGFPVGRKWKFTRLAKGNVKYLICNADEGDPGAYMDRSLLEGNPQSVLEGMLVGAYAIGARQGFIYVRNEYPLAVKNITIAINQARGHGLLGENILNSGFDFDVKIVRGAGAFVSGEETALMASIESRKGEPRQRPPFPVQRGLWGKPTNINNVETWANVPMIMSKGADWYAQIGTKGSKGTKIFSLVGKINNTGLVEVPMGMTLREIVYDIGGGIPNNKELKAVQTGGPSGGCMPKELLDLPIDFESLTEVGSMMGSGGMIVMDEETCIVDVAKYFMNFLEDESCGKCFTCRKGTQRMHEILEDISNGEGTLDQLHLLEELAEVVRDTTMCGLGQTAANPVLSTLRYFRDEYLDHIENKRCPAGVCKELITYVVNDNCTGCMVCLRACPEEAITGSKREMHVIDLSKCIKCGICRSLCKFDAVDVI